MNRDPLEALAAPLRADFHNWLAGQAPRSQERPEGMARLAKALKLLAQRYEEVQEYCRSHNLPLDFRDPRVKVLLQFGPPQSEERK